jgi:putative SOS response-associated peptidase YedK
MCGRAYSTYTEEELYFRYLNDKRKRQPLGDEKEGSRLKPNYNLCPTQLAPVVFVRDGHRVIEMFRFGLVPFWAKDVASVTKYSLINARAEEILEKRSYKTAFEKRRCIVPLTGFYEWQRNEGGAKRPFEFHSRDHSILSMAGVWEHWKSPETPQEIHSFSIITTTANSLMEKIHNRMPVILDREVEEEWLDPAQPHPEVLLKLLKPCPSERLETHEVSTLVNSPKNNRIEILNPISSS